MGQDIGVGLDVEVRKRRTRRESEEAYDYYYIRFLLLVRDQLHEHAQEEVRLHDMSR